MSQTQNQRKFSRKEDEAWEENQESKMGRVVRIIRAMVVPSLHSVSI